MHFENNYNINIFLKLINTTDFSHTEYFRKMDAIKIGLKACLVVPNKSNQ